MKPFKRILHPTDFSPASAPAFRQALVLARQFDIPLTALYVHTLPMPMLASEEPSWVQMEWREEIERELHDTVPDQPGVELNRVVQEGQPEKVIVQYADEHHCELIVMGTHGRTGLRHLLLGSIAERVVRHAHCPVMIVPSFERAKVKETEDLGVPATASYIMT